MIEILPVHPALRTYLQKHNLVKKFDKQVAYFAQNPFHPSLHTELLEPRHMRIWSFRLDKRYRALFFFHDTHTIEIIDINDHYQ